MSSLNWRPLTAAQEGIWYAQAVDPKNPDQNLVDYLDIRGPLRLAFLEKAFNQVMAETGSARLGSVRTKPDHGRPSNLRATTGCLWSICGMSPILRRRPRRGCAVTRRVRWICRTSPCPS